MNKCNENKTNYSKFPFAYNFTSEPYTQNEETYGVFTGSDSVHFGVVDYEVFLVFRWLINNMAWLLNTHQYFNLLFFQWGTPSSTEKGYLFYEDYWY